MPQEVTALRTPVSCLSMARVSIANAAWFKRGGNLEQCRLSLASARFFIGLARKRWAA
ncbi:MAG TPA: hypothetical protein VGU03_11060 [Frateuria sp.]|uniref:hypothetical protein n=1 Tax=Frateuria sp. TaxID=2211372 RepID=UPI002DE771ED|nr:hypothetical protein [Frateuria sp.]